jgi:predicted outer membrane repeat protein
LEDRLAPATLTVNSTADTASDSDPYLSLREAIAIVNSATLPADLSDQILGQISGTLHDSGADTIAFDLTGVTGPIVLSGSQLELSLPGSTASVTIDGGSGVTVDGNNASRVLLVDSGVQATLDHLTVTHGRIMGDGSSVKGGGISNSGTLAVENSTIASNMTRGLIGGGGSGGGIYNTGSLTVTDSSLSANVSMFGGGIYSAGTLTINNSRFTSNTANASSGGAGGIYNSGTLTVTGSTFTNNQSSVGGGAIYSNTGVLTVSGCTFTGNGSLYGGAIASGLSGSLNVTDSVFDSNTGRGGGALDNSVLATVSGCTFHANSTLSFGEGGGIVNSGTLTVSHCTLDANSSTMEGGGISSGGTLTVTDCTLTGNSAGNQGGGGIFNVGTLTVLDCTISGNTAFGHGGGISTTGTLQLQGTIVAGNVSRFMSTPRGPDLSGPVAGDSSYNLVGIDDGDLSGISDGVNHNQVGTPDNLLDPLLSPLGDYGGPTRTFALLPSSPALGAGDPNNPETTDQRGLPRVVGGLSDIGAFQTQANPLLVTTLTDPGRLPGLLSLREAVNLAATLPGSNTVSFDPSLASGTVNLTAGELLLGHDVAIAGPSGGLTVSGNNASRVLEIATGVTVSVSGLTIANGSVSSASMARGGGILNAGNLSLTDCTVSNNQAVVNLTGTGTEDVLAQGGGIATTGALTLVRCTLSGNSATVSAGNLDYGQANGGGLYASGSSVTLTDSTVAGNSAVATFGGGSGLVYAYGGGLTSDQGTLTLSGCTISGNTASGGNGDGYGGGLHAYQSTVSLTNCTVANNTAGSGSGAGYGGGLSDLGGSFTLTSCTVSGNAAASTVGAGSGGGLYFDGSAGSFQVDNTIVAGNSAATNGSDASGNFSSLGYNLVGITDGSSGWGSSDLTGTAASPLDPGLEPLSDNGGPTQTMALLAGSPARRAGDPGLLGTADQRGVLRSGAVDIGAFQVTSG